MEPYDKETWNLVEGIWHGNDLDKFRTCLPNVFIRENSYIDLTEDDEPQPSNNAHASVENDPFKPRSTESSEDAASDFEHMELDIPQIPTNPTQEANYEGSFEIINPCEADFLNNIK